jgi:hypothetical protein
MTKQFASHSVEEIYEKKSKPGAKEHKSNITDMDGLFLYSSNGNGQ